METAGLTVLALEVPALLLSVVTSMLTSSTTSPLSSEIPRMFPLSSRIGREDWVSPWRLMLTVLMLF